MPGWRSDRPSDSLGEVEEALSHLEAASTTDPSRFEAPYLAAAVLDRAGRLSEAVDNAARAVELAPRDAGMRRFLGRLLLRIEHWPEAQAELERALQLGYREDPAIFADLGAALLGQERLLKRRGPPTSGTWSWPRTTPRHSCNWDISTGAPMNTRLPKSSSSARSPSTRVSGEPTTSWA